MREKTSSWLRDSDEVYTLKTLNILIFLFLWWCSTLMTLEEAKEIRAIIRRWKKFQSFNLSNNDDSSDGVTTDEQKSRKSCDVQQKHCEFLQHETWYSIMSESSRFGYLKNWIYSYSKLIYFALLAMKLCVDIWICCVWEFAI